MKLFRNFAFLYLLFYGLNLFSQKISIEKESPLAVAKIIGNKLINDTPFKYNLSVFNKNPFFNGLQRVNFKRTFGVNNPAIAYAYTTLDSPKATVIEMQFANNDGIKIWLNDKLIYQFIGDK